MKLAVLAWVMVGSRLAAAGDLAELDPALTPPLARAERDASPNDGGERGDRVRGAEPQAFQRIEDGGTGYLVLGVTITGLSLLVFVWSARAGTSPPSSTIDPPCGGSRSSRSRRSATAICDNVR